MERDVFIVAVRRTALARAGGRFRRVPVEHLGAAPLAALSRGYVPDPRAVDEVILGNVVGPGGNVARLAALAAGLPEEVPGLTVDRQCTAGLEALRLGAALIAAGQAHVVLAGGAESITREPWKLQPPETAFSPQPPRFVERPPFAPPERGDPEMGEAAENLARRYGIGREEQDRWAWESHRRAAVEAQAAGRFDPLLTPVSFRGLAAAAQRDDTPRPRLRPEVLRRLRPLFAPDGTVTAGNTSQKADGAAVALLCSERGLRRLGAVPVARWAAAAAAGVDPRMLGLALVPAATAALVRAGVAPAALDAAELNEAFAAQVLACLKELPLDPARVNPLGGAIALGHPYGATGAVLLGHLLVALTDRGGRFGLVALAAGGGLGVAAVLERLGGTAPC